MPLFGAPRAPPVPGRRARPRRYVDRPAQPYTELLQRIGRALEPFYPGNEEDIAERVDRAPPAQFDCPAFFLQPHPDDTERQRLLSFITVKHGLICVHEMRELGVLPDGNANVRIENHRATVLGTTFGTEYWRRIEDGGFNTYGYDLQIEDSIDALRPAAGPTLVLVAPCGAGKTTATIDYIRVQPENYRILWLTPRRSLAQQTYEMLKDSGFIHYYDLRKMQRNLSASEPCHMKVICTPESLHHIPMRDGGFLNFDVVVIDEFTLVASGLADAVTHDHTLFQHMHYLKFLLTHSRQNVVMCADFLASDANIQLLHMWDIPCHIGVVRPPRYERAVEAYVGNQALFDRMLFNDIKEGRRVFVACSTRAECTRLWQLAMNLLDDDDRRYNDAMNRMRCGEPDIDEDAELVRKRSAAGPVPEMYLYYHRGCGQRQTDDFKDVNKSWATAAAVFTTTKASVGISCTLDDHFYGIYCYMLPRGAGVREMVQLTMRVRNPQSRVMRVFVSSPSPGAIIDSKPEHVDVIAPPWRSKHLLECEKEEQEEQQQNLGQWEKLWKIYRVEDNPLRPEFSMLRSWRRFEQAKDHFTLVSLFEACDRNRWSMHLFSLDDEVKEKEEVVDDMVANWSTWEQRLFAHLNTTGETIDEVVQRRKQVRRSRFEKDAGDFLLAQRPYIGTPLERLFFYAPHVYYWVNRHSGAIFRLARMLRGPIPVPAPEQVIIQENSQFSESESYRLVPSACWDHVVEAIVREVGIYPLGSEPAHIADDVLTERMGAINTSAFPTKWTKAKSFRRNVGTVLSKTIGLSLIRVPHTTTSRTKWLGVETGAGRTTVFDWATALVAHDSPYIN